jgi:hypothetical protein
MCGFTDKKITVLLSQQGQGEWGSPAAGGKQGLGYEGMDLALEPPQEAQQLICGGKAGHDRTGK